MPRRTSEQSKKRQGTLRADRVKPTVKLKPVNPEPDAELHPTARAEWRRIVKAMSKHGLVSADLDASTLRVYCQNVERVRDAEAHLTVEGEIIQVPVMNTHNILVGYKPVKNPWLAIMQSCERSMMRAAESLGLTPASRTKQGKETRVPNDEGEEAIDGMQDALEALKDYR